MRKYKHLLLGIVVILGLNGGACSTEKKDITVYENSVNNVVYQTKTSNYISIEKDPEHGEAKIDPNTYKALYTPNIDYIGKDFIKIKIDIPVGSDSYYGGTSYAEISINVVESNLVRNNNNPIANDQNITIDFETETAFNLTGSDEDNDTLIFVIETNTSNGTIVLIDETTGDVTYTPNQDYSGPDNFTFKVVDEHNGSSNIADVNITVKSLCETYPTAPGCPGFDPCNLDPTAPGCPQDPCIIDPTDFGCPLDPCILDPFSIECQNSIPV